VPDPIREKAAQWRADNPKLASTHKPVWTWDPCRGWTLDRVEPIRRGPNAPGSEPERATGGIIPASTPTFAVDEDERVCAYPAIDSVIGRSQLRAAAAMLEGAKDVDAAALAEEARSYNWGVQLHLTKPSEPDELQRLIERDNAAIAAAAPAPPATAWGRLLDDARALGEAIADTLRRRLRGDR